MQVESCSGSRFALCAYVYMQLLVMCVSVCMCERKGHPCIMRCAFGGRMVKEPIEHTPILWGWITITLPLHLQFRDQFSMARILQSTMGTSSCSDVLCQVVGTQALTEV